MKVGDTYSDALNMCGIVGRKEEHEEGLDGAVLSGEIKGAVDGVLVNDCCVGEVRMVWSRESSVDEV